MSGRDAHAKHCRANGEPERRVQHHRLAVDTRVHGRGGEDLEVRCAPSAPWRMPPGIRCVENDDAQKTAIERGATAEDRRAQRIGVVRNQHNSELSMLPSYVVDEAQRRCPSTGAGHPIGRLHKSADLGVAIGRMADRLTVDPERDVVHECAAVHFCQVDPPLYPIGERVERARHVLPIHSEVEREVVSCPGRDADERHPMRGGGRCHDRKGPVATSHPQRVRALPHRLVDALHEALARIENDHLDPAIPCPFSNPRTARRPIARSWVDKQHRT